ncbi:unnamed protein product [Vitrella brassicaformis CCMP3155]|uniref:Uncharacterized protein n=1 Tax=Vitrella brassicaformis (strain CCMP3155) TaxID=1169540 RepID=A0A0G4G0X9_VITBC|nr:unnamed protein product [Vitrella brassicaformis CCMP3155]|eukprot:CEM21730.1 unnamed protein product [Vitrella brassicaformis CCMP3155]
MLRELDGKDAAATEVYEGVAKGKGKAMMSRCMPRFKMTLSKLKARTQPKDRGPLGWFRHGKSTTNTFNDAPPKGMVAQQEDETIIDTPIIAGGTDLIGTVQQEDPDTPLIETVRAAPTMIDAKLALPGGSADRHYFSRHVLRAATEDEKEAAEHVHDAMKALHYRGEEDDGCHT